MIAWHRNAAAFVMTIGLASPAFAQAPAQGRPQSPAQGPRPSAAGPNQPGSRPAPQRRTAYRPARYQPYGGLDQAHPGYSSVVRHQGYPYQSDSTYGFRNPGGIGRFEEYYPPGNEFQNGGHDPTAQASFDKGAGYDINEQMAAQNTGTNRYRAIQQHIDNFARPMGFWGWGGGFGPY